MTPTRLLTTLPLALLFCLMSSGCAGAGSAGTSEPGWVRDAYEHPDVRAALQMAAVGSSPGVDGQAREQARRRALAAIAADIQVRVQSEIETEMSSRRSDQGHVFSDGILESIKTTAEEELPGARLIDQWVDRKGGQTWVIVDVRRELLIDGMVPPVEEANGAAAELLAAAPPSDLGRALLNAADAYGVVSATYADASRARAVGQGSPFGGRADAAWGRSTQLLRSAAETVAALAGRLVVRKISGDGQEGRVRGALAMPLVAQFSVRADDGSTTPLVDFPVRFRADAEPGPTFALESTTTDAEGRVECRVSDLTPTGRANNAVSVEPDLASRAPALSVAQLPNEVFTYRLPTPGQTRIAVDVASRFEGRALDPDALAADLAGFLSAAGFDARTQPGLAALDLDALRKVMGSGTDYVIRGIAGAHYSSRQGQLHYFRASAQLEIVELRSGAVQSITTPDELAGHSDAGEQGAVKALRALSPRLEGQLEREFVSLFVPGDAR